MQSSLTLEKEFALLLSSIFVEHLLYTKYWGAVLRGSTLGLHMLMGEKDIKPLHQEIFKRVEGAKLPGE